MTHNLFYYRILRKLFDDFVTVVTKSGQKRTRPEAELPLASYGSEIRWSTRTETAIGNPDSAQNELCASREEHVSTSAVHQGCIKTPFAGGAGTYEGIGRTQFPVFHARDCNPPRLLSNPKLSKLTFFCKIRSSHRPDDQASLTR